MRKLSLLMMIFGLFVVTACDSDSGNDDGGDLDVFVGAWALSGFSTGGQDITSVVGQQYSTFMITFDSANQVELRVVNVETPNEPTVISGTYSVNESTEKVSLDVSVSGQAASLSFDYEIVNDNQIALTASSTTTLLIASPLLLNTSLADPVVITVSRI